MALPRSKTAQHKQAILGETALGGLLGWGLAPDGHGSEGTRRGLGRGLGTGIGMSAGALLGLGLGQGIGSLTTGAVAPGQIHPGAILGMLAGYPIGGFTGYHAAGGIMGPASDKYREAAGTLRPKDKDKDKDTDKDKSAKQASLRLPTSTSNASKPGACRMATPKQILMQRLREINCGTKTASVRQSNGLIELLINAGHALNGHYKTAGGGIAGLPLAGGMSGLGRPGAAAAATGVVSGKLPPSSRVYGTPQQRAAFDKHMADPNKTGLVPDGIMAARQVSDQERRGGPVPVVNPDGSHNYYRYRPTWSPAFQQAEARERAFAESMRNYHNSAAEAPRATPKAINPWAAVE